MKLFHLLALAGMGGALALATPVLASSHAEAPLIAEDPQADNTDTYFFRSPQRADRVVVLANYIPMEEPSGGPTYHYFSDRVVYEINFDRNSDGKDDVSFQFRFKTRVQTPGTLLPYLGPITDLTTDGKTVATAANINPLYNRYQTYDLWMVNRSGRNAKPQRIASNVIVPPNNAGSSTCPDYASLVAKATHTVSGSGIRTFCGQVDDPFYIDLGAVFDLLRVRPYRSLHALNGAIPLPDRADAPDSLSGFNCHTIAMEIPITFLTKTAGIPIGTDPKRVLGMYASASRQKISVLRTGKVAGQGKFVQVSRLGAPLVNELFIPLADDKNRTRDVWNMTDPSSDAKFRTFFQFPEVALRLAQLYPVLRPVIPNINATQTGFTAARNDLLGGATPLLNFAPDFLRLDVSVAPNPTPNRLGALGGDTQGFPNGRRVGDDVVDIYMRAAAGALLPGNVTVGSFTGTRGAFLDAINFGDGVNAHENGRVPFPNAFPFQGIAHNGVNPAHIGFDDPERENTDN
jgi:hypothetical protein